MNWFCTFICCEVVSFIIFANTFTSDMSLSMNVKTTGSDQVDSYHKSVLTLKDKERYISYNITEYTSISFGKFYSAL